MHVSPPRERPSAASVSRARRRRRVRRRSARSFSRACSCSVSDPVCPVSTAPFPQPRPAPAPSAPPDPPPSPPRHGVPGPPWNPRWPAIYPPDRLARPQPSISAANTPSVPPLREPVVHRLPSAELLGHLPPLTPIPVRNRQITPSNCSRNRCGYGPNRPISRNGSINVHSASLNSRRVTSGFYQPGNSQQTETDHSSGQALDGWLPLCFGTGQNPACDRLAA